MNNLYVVAIGGSGERVLRSFIMALTVGVDVNVNSVIPVIVDNDSGSMALQKCKNLIKSYSSEDSAELGLNYMLEQSKLSPSFCKTKIAQPIILDVSGGGIGTLKQIINCPTATGEDDPAADAAVTAAAIKALQVERDLLFTEDELTMKLNVGFVGCPNVGSVVLNSKSLVDQKFQHVLSATNEDGIIVVGSLFGGTGAAGIPLIVNKLAKSNGAKLGVVMMLPFFDVTTEKDKDNMLLQGYDVCSDEFDVKTRAALMYYRDYLSTSVNNVYYVGDNNRHLFKKSLGGKKQDNPATLCDLMAAMSIVDFAKNNNTDKGKTVYKRPLWGFNDSDPQLSTCVGITNLDLQKAIVKFILMQQCFRHKEIFPMAVNSEKQVWDFVQNIGFDSKVLNSILSSSTDNLPFSKARSLNILFKEVDAWLDELSNGNKLTQRLASHLKVFDNDSKVSSDNIATAFYSEESTGLAKMKSEGHFWSRELKPVPTIILNKLQTAYRNLPEEYKKNVPEDRIIPVILMYISDALDEVIKNCFNITIKD